MYILLLTMKRSSLNYKIHYRLDIFVRVHYIHYSTNIFSKGKESSTEVHVTIPSDQFMQQKDIKYLITNVSLSKLPIYSGPYFSYLQNAGGLDPIIFYNPIYLHNFMILLILCFQISHSVLRSRFVREMSI